jgi:hypothetical protein
MQMRANSAAEHYMRSMYGNPKYFKSVSFSALEKRRYATALDTSLMMAGVDTNNHREAQRYADSESGQRPDLTTKNTEDVYNIKHDKLSYYLLIYSFRVDSEGDKKFMRYRLEMDTAFRVINARDVTHGGDRP